MSFFHISKPIYQKHKGTQPKYTWSIQETPTQGEEEEHKSKNSWKLEKQAQLVAAINP